MKPGRPLPNTFYLGDTIEVARSLLGCILWRRLGSELLAVRIVETEAYLGANDMASHVRRGLRSPRNESMYLAGGHAYVYFTYGMHHCVNVVTQEDGIPEAALIRAGEPVHGVAAMRERRRVTREREIASGPGRLCQALGIDRSLDGTSLRGRELFITKRPAPVGDEEIAVSSRDGVEGAGDSAWWPLRFYLEASPHVSKWKDRGSRVEG